MYFPKFFSSSPSNKNLDFFLDFFNNLKKNYLFCLVTIFLYYFLLCAKVKNLLKFGSINEKTQNFAIP